MNFENGGAKWIRAISDEAKVPERDADLLQQDFSASAPNQKWAGDITYVWIREGWVYLAVIIDLLSRRVVGSAIRYTKFRTLPHYLFSASFNFCRGRLGIFKTFELAFLQLEPLIALQPNASGPLFVALFPHIRPFTCMPLFPEQISQPLVDPLP